jgi:hypothetical protein
MLFTYSKCIISLKTKLIILYEIGYFKKISFDTWRVQVILDVVCRPLELIVLPRAQDIWRTRNRYISSFVTKVDFRIENVSTFQKHSTFRKHYFIISIFLASVGRPIIPLRSRHPYFEWWGNSNMYDGENVATQDRVIPYYAPDSSIKHSKSDSKDRSQEILWSVKQV